MSCRWILLLSGSLFASAGVGVADATPRDAVCDDESVTLFQAKAGSDTGAQVARSYKEVVGAEPEEKLNTLAKQRNEKAILVEAENQQEAEVRFVRHGNQYSYKMSATSVYTHNAEATVWTEHGLVNLKKRNRLFKSREPGMWAQATMHEDGTVSGLFEDHGRIMRITKGEHNFPNPKEVRARGDVNRQTMYHPHNDESDPNVIAVDYAEDMPHVDREAVSADVPGKGDNFPRPSTLPWDGELWYPDCYPGDSKMNDVKISVIADTKAHSESGASLEGIMEQAVHEASFIFERQMNLRLVIDQLKIYETTTGLSGKELEMQNASCVDGDEVNFMMDKLRSLSYFMVEGLSGIQTNQALTYMFTGCGDGSGIIGASWYGFLRDDGSFNGLCSTTGGNTGIMQVLGDDTFLTFAHEVGHGLGMHHPNDYDKEKSSGGIMDRMGNGLLNGYYQFNTAYRRAEACPVLAARINECGDRFGLKVHDDPYEFLMAIILYILQLLEEILNSLTGGSLLPTDLRSVDMAESTLESIIHNFVYQNVLVIARSQSNSDDETVVVQKTLDAMKAPSVKEKMEKLIVTLSEMNPVQREIAKQVLPHLDVSKTYGLVANAALKSAKADILKLL